MSLDPDKVQRAFKQAGFAPFFTPKALASLVSFTNRMLELNQFLNLTRYTREEDVLQFHLLDSAYALEPTRSLLAEKPSPRVLDLGSGCGFPGVTFAAAFPTWEVTLMDSVVKKVKALEESLKGTQLKASTLCARAEKLGQDPAARESWDGVFTRAVGDFPVVLEYSLPLLKSGGYFVDWITANQMKAVDKSQKALLLLGGKIVQLKEYSLSSVNLSRWLVFVEKMGKTQICYPRLAGKPKKNPL
jgi:16S rRNA (guanine527-N7)-methyltransferase